MTANLEDILNPKYTTSGFELAIRKLQFVDQLCLLADHCAFFVKFANQKTFLLLEHFFRETVKFLFALQARQLA